MLAGITGPLAAARSTPIGPVATAIGSAITPYRRAISTPTGEIRMVNFPAAARRASQTAEVSGPNGARARVSGGDGVTYYWPTGRIRLDGLIEMARRRAADWAHRSFASRAAARR